jgi:hypothetical protein
MRLHPLVAILVAGAFFLAMMAVIALAAPGHPFARDLLRAVQILGLAALVVVVVTAPKDDGAKH